MSLFTEADIKSCRNHLDSLEYELAYTRLRQILLSGEEQCLPDMKTESFDAVAILSMFAQAAQEVGRVEIARGLGKSRSAYTAFLDSGRAWLKTVLPTRLIFQSPVTNETFELTDDGMPAAHADSTDALESTEGRTSVARLANAALAYYHARMATDIHEEVLLTKKECHYAVNLFNILSENLDEEPIKQMQGIIAYFFCSIFSDYFLLFSALFYY